MDCEIPDPATTAAAHPASYISLYALSAVLLVLGILAWFLGANQKPPFSRLWYRFYPLYLLLAAIGYGMWAIYCHAYTDGDNFVLSFRLLITLSVDPLIGIAFCLGEGMLANKRFWQVLWILSGIFMLAVLAAAAATSSDVTVAGVAGFVMFVALISWTAAAWLRPSVYNWLKVIAGAVLVVAQVVLGILQPLCGPEAHDTCYAHCPSQPGFQHVVFACLAGTGYLLLMTMQMMELDLIVAPDFFSCVTVWFEGTSPTSPAE
ncbi:unnamed protein product [Symbiodinium pilosum]|uniref:Uncharacterized protein n=1 Tax=Symbiodinium pilosum TaxID=2952 RepID=A0A812IUL8_SYMPI|nr:unnamed protein product [Symbiodinium pilosum]